MRKDHFITFTGWIVECAVWANPFKRLSPCEPLGNDSTGAEIGGDGVPGGRIISPYDRR